MTHGETMKEAILSHGLALWRQDVGFVSARAIAKRLGMTHSAILYHFGTSEALKAAIAGEAVRVGCRVIVPQLIVANHPAAAGIDPARRAAFLSLPA